MPTNQILQHLKKHDERLDTEIAEAVGMSLATARLHLSELTTKGKVMSCHLTRYVEGKKTGEWFAGWLGIFLRWGRVEKQSDVVLM